MRTALKDKKREVAIEMLIDQVSKGQMQEFEVISDSMRPLIRKGDMVDIEKVKPNHLQKGDLIVFQHDGKFLVHRLIGFKEKQSGQVLITKGDNNYHFDAFPVTFRQVIGKIVTIKRQGLNFNISSRFWFYLNLIMNSISKVQANSLIFLQFLRKKFLNNRVFPPGEIIRNGICHMFYVLQQCTIFIPLKLVGNKESK